MNGLKVKDDRVITVILNRPEKKNAFDPKTAEELPWAYREFNADARCFALPRARAPHDL